MYLEEIFNYCARYSVKYLTHIVKNAFFSIFTKEIRCLIKFGLILKFDIWHISSLKRLVIDSLVKHGLSRARKRQIENMTVQNPDLCIRLRKICTYFTVRQ